jgi:pimeloyl-ACP methyl ester carboxylesterase
MSEQIEVWLRQCAADAFVHRASAGLFHQILVRATSGAWALKLDGQALSVGDASIPHNPNFVSIQANDKTWSQLLGGGDVQANWQGFGAISRLNRAFDIEGTDLAIAQCLPVLERMIELAHGEKAPLGAALAPLDPTQIRGAYSHLSLTNGTRPLVYFEQVGEGIPLVMLHTAGADSRQYHYQMSDVDIAVEWGMYAFDMPGHGRSSMPTGWVEGKAYSLSLDDYLDTCSAFIEQVVGGPAVIMGCSMGAAMSLVLAARRPDLVLGIIALEAPWRAPGRKSPLLADARINASLHNPGYVRGLMGPNSPRHFREEACWIYSQAGFGVYAGDLGFYSEQFDGEVIGTELRGTTIPIQLLTGEFDYSASPDNTRILAQLIETADFKEMKGLGHFPMIEDPGFFRGYWVDALDRIKAQMGRALD